MVWFYALFVLIDTWLLISNYVVCCELITEYNDDGLEIDIKYIPSSFRSFYNYYIAVGHEPHKALKKASNFKLRFGTLPLLGLVMGLVIRICN